MNKHVMINEAREHLSRAKASFLRNDIYAFIREFAIAEFLINKLEYFYDYDFMDEETSDPVSNYVFCFERFKRL